MCQLDLFSALQSSIEASTPNSNRRAAACPAVFGSRIPRWTKHKTQGGTIVLSAAEKTSGLVWEGVPDAAQLRTVHWGQLNDRHKVSANWASYRVAEAPLQPLFASPSSAAQAPQAAPAAELHYPPAMDVARMTASFVHY